MPRHVLELAPFRGLRYAKPDVDRFVDGDIDIARLLAPPYDIPDAAQARELQRSDPHNAARVTLPFELTRLIPDHSEAPNDAGAVHHRYGAAAALLRAWMDDGVLTLDREPALYVYEQAAPDGQWQRGLMGALRLPDEPADSEVRPHEDVADAPVSDRFRLMDATRANLEPIFLVYRGRGGAASAATEAVHGDPLVATRTRDGTQHRLWAITDPQEHRRIAQDLANRSALIADGHHRYAAYQRLHTERSDPGWRYGLALLVDSDTHPPRLDSIHRLVPGLDTDQAVEAARTVATVTPVGAVGQDALHALAEAAAPALLLTGPDGSAHLVSGFDEQVLNRAMSGRSPYWRHLPTAALHEVLLPLWRTPEERVRMVHDDPAAAVSAARDTEGTAIIVPAMAVDQVYAVADRGELTPRKSTSFGPKPQTGLVMRLLPS